MKKIVTLLIAAAAFTSSFAQSNDMEEAKRIVLGERKDSRSSSPSNNSKDVILGSDGRRVVYNPRDTRYPTGTTSRSKTEQINREYDAKIRSIRNNPNLSSAEKERIIRDLNNQRARRIREVNGDNRKYDERKYEGKRYDKKDCDDDDDYDNNKYKKTKSKGNNGNHYGWQKGKGNPHKSI